MLEVPLNDVFVACFDGIEVMAENEEGGDVDGETFQFVANIEYATFIGCAIPAASQAIGNVDELGVEATHISLCEGLHDEFPLRTPWHRSCHAFITRRLRR
jgi:hypothetical protein